MSEPRRKTDVFVMLWLVMSTLMNISGMASVVDGLVTWRVFFKDLVVTYREWVREPVAAAFNWIGVSLPHWLTDAFVLYGGLYFTLAAFYRIRMGISLSHDFASIWKEAGHWIERVLFVPWALFLPFSYLVMFFIGKVEEVRLPVMGMLKWYLGLFVVFVVMLFLNWQLQARL